MSCTLTGANGNYDSTAHIHIGFDQEYSVLGTGRNGYLSGDHVFFLGIEGNQKSMCLVVDGNLNGLTVGDGGGAIQSAALGPAQPLQPGEKILAGLIQNTKITQAKAHQGALAVNNQISHERFSFRIHASAFQTEQLYHKIAEGTTWTYGKPRLGTEKAGAWFGFDANADAGSEIDR